jgi:hypothetical protein
MGTVFAFVILLSFVIVFMANVYALGVTPGRTSFDYKPGKSEEVVFSVINNDHKRMNLVFMINGELNDSITLLTNDSDGVIEFLPSDESKQFKYTIKFPGNIVNNPGLHTAEIVALELPQVNGEGNYVGATVGVATQLYVYVPCPDKCIDSDIDVFDAEQNSTATFVVPVINRGQVGIGNVRAIIDIYNLDYEKKDSITTDGLSVEAGARTELSGKWNVNVNSGNYIAKVAVIYDGESKNFEKQFSVGNQILNIENIFVNDFRLGEIAKLQILVENKWNQDLKSIYANLLVYNDADQIMADVKSANEDIPSLQKKTLIAYWDTVGVEEGEYEGKLMIVNGKKSTDKNLVLKVNEESLDIFGVGYTVQPQGRKGVDITTILLVLVIILLIVNLAWFVFFRRMMGKNQGRKD